MHIALEALREVQNVHLFLMYTAHLIEVVPFEVVTISSTSVVEKQNRSTNTMVFTSKCSPDLCGQQSNILGLYHLAEEQVYHQ